MNELRNVGAEAIGVGGVRVVAARSSPARWRPLDREHRPGRPGFEILAIGNPPALTGALTRAGGIVAQLQATYRGGGRGGDAARRRRGAGADRTLVPTLGQPRP